MSSTASAAPTSIPHHERSSHHQTEATLSPIDTSRLQSIPLSSSSSASYSTSPPLVSPLYAGANRVFAASSSPSSRWSPSNPKTNSISTSPKLEKEYFDGPWGKNGLNKSSAENGSVGNGLGHHRRATSGSLSSSISSLGGGGEPTTPKEGISGTSSLNSGFGMPLGRVPSLPLSSNGSYEAAQKRLSGSGPANGSNGNGGGTWGSLSSSFRGNKNAIATGSSPTEKSSGPMGSLLRSFSISRSNGPTSPPLSAANSQPISSPTFNHPPPNAAASSPSSATLPAVDSSLTSQSPTMVEGRGRKASVGQGGKRRPSPMGERLLMGHFNAH